MKKESFDFSGYATRYEVQCSDGRIIGRGSFRHQDGKKVPLLWQHNDSTPENVIGSAYLRHRYDGVYAECVLNDSHRARSVMDRIQHGDVRALSITAGGIREKDGMITHGNIGEISVVVSGANPEAYIDEIVISHEDSSNTTFVCYETDFECGEDGYSIRHSSKDSDDYTEDSDDSDDSDDYTVRDFLNDELSEMRNSLEKEIQHSVKEKIMQMTNVFENPLNYNANSPDLDCKDILMTAKKNSTWKQACVHHDMDTTNFAIRDAISHATPSFDPLINQPKVTSITDIVHQYDEWVKQVIGGVNKSPFSQIAMITSDITTEEARANGYITGTEKTGITLDYLRRKISPTTLYITKTLDRDDIIDIEDIDYVEYLWRILRNNLDEAVSQAILTGDTRVAGNVSRFDPTRIIPIISDSNLFTIKETTTNWTSTSAIVDEITNALYNKYRGDVSKGTLFVNPSLIGQFLTLRDTIGRRIYSTIGDVTNEIGIAKIVPCWALTGPNKAVFVNLSDYTIGCAKGGEITTFEDFDIKFNQNTYLIETRLSGALTRPYSAVAFMDVV